MRGDHATFTRRRERCRAVTLLIRVKTVQREPFFAIQANDAMTCPLDIIQERG